MSLPQSSAAAQQPQQLQDNNEMYDSTHFDSQSPNPLYDASVDVPPHDFRPQLTINYTTEYFDGELEHA